MTSPGTVATKALPSLERSSGPAMDPVTEMTVSSNDWLIFSVISDSSLTLKNNQDQHSHSVTSASTTVQVVIQTSRGGHALVSPVTS